MINKCDHLLGDILFIALCTLLSNGEDFEDMKEFGCQRIDWLQKYIELPNGIPSHDTFNRVFQAIDPEQLKKVLKEDGKALIDHLRGQLINFDGKKLRGVSPKSKGNKGLYILSAWVSESRLCIGQQKVNDKSNEITAIPIYWRRFVMLFNIIHLLMLVMNNGNMSVVDMRTEHAIY